MIYISKELKKEITFKNGTKLTTISPNIQDKFANVLAGTVDLTVRAYMDGEDRFLQLEKKENVFGGGRFDFKVKKIPLDMKEFSKALEESQKGVKTYSKMTATEETAPAEDKKATKRRTKKEEDTVVEEVNEPKEESIEDDKPVEEEKEEKPRHRSRRKKTE